MHRTVPSSLRMRFLTDLLRQTAFRQQLFTAVTTGVFCIALFSSLLSSWQGSRQIRATMVGQGERIAESLAGQSSLALLTASSDNASEAVKATLAFPDVTRVEIRQPDSRPLLVRGHNGVATADPNPPSPNLRQAYLEAETSDSWRFVAPVLSKKASSPFEVEERADEYLGYVRVEQSKATLTRMMTNVFLVNFAISFFIAIFFLAVIRYLSLRLTRPLTLLSAAMARAERGEANVRAELSGPRDIVEMAQAFNSMIAALQDREEALRESQQQYREVVETVKEVIFQTDADGHWELLNPAWREITGFEQEESLGRRMLDYLHEEDHAQIEAWQEKMRSGERRGARYEARFHRANGQVGWAEITQRVRADASGQFAGTSGILDDITERKKAEQELEAYRAHLEDQVSERTSELEAANKELEAFSYSVSHDLRAPLRRVNGFSHMLEEDYGDKLDSVGRDYLNRIRLAIDNMDQLIDAMLQLAKVSRGDLRLEPLNLSDMASAQIEELRTADPQRVVEVEITPAMHCVGDPGLMRAVLQNLLGNAWKYSGKRSVAKITFSQTETPQGLAYFVQDNGAGFDMVHARNLFGAFQRLHTKAEFEGTGVGLATVQRIIHRHGGHIWAEAEVDVGATFYFILPERLQP
ncbi:sensor histidine kinase [Parachitinimonas caeni]|uniref:histidine kinase n=1 Tax=Parachitinimonas caeni TaxID=3031301 RepID=A0ABT7E7K6_9NEIS|nr:PAS domain S-box protein [Parachitinimonas caeni]MDK2126897.1 PAS domain S-box protein [Parachitinimonas caeni]